MPQRSGRRRACAGRTGAREHSEPSAALHGKAPASFTRRRAASWFPCTLCRERSLQTNHSQGTRAGQGRSLRLIRTRRAICAPVAALGGSSDERLRPAWWGLLTTAEDKFKASRSHVFTALGGFVGRRDCLGSGCRDLRRGFPRATSAPAPGTPTRRAGGAVPPAPGAPHAGTSASQCRPPPRARHLGEGKRHRSRLDGGQLGRGQLVVSQRPGADARRYVDRLPTRRHPLCPGRLRPPPSATRPVPRRPATSRASMVPEKLPTR